MDEENKGTINDTMQQKPKKSASDRVQGAKNKYDKSKKAWNTIKGIKSLAPLVTVITWVAVILLIVFLLIGAIGFFVTLPGLAIDKFTEACTNFWKWCWGKTEINVSDGTVDDVAAYIEEMGYDLVGYGFVSSDGVQENEQTGKKTVNWKTAKRQNLYGYVLSNERTYCVQGNEGGLLVNLTGGIPLVGDLINGLDSLIRDKWAKDEGKYGLIVFSANAFNWKEGSQQKGNFDVSVNRDTEELQITTHKGFLGFDRDIMKWNLSGWTSRYGKPIELSLALHLSTMSPDFTYKFCSDQDLQTKVKMKTTWIKYKLNYSFQKKGYKKIYKNKTEDTPGIVDKYNEYAESQSHILTQKVLFNDQILLATGKKVDEGDIARHKGYNDRRSCCK